MTEFVLLRKNQRTIDGEEAATLVADRGFRLSAEHLGVSTSTLRKFLRDEGFRFKRNTTWQVEHLPGMEPDVTDGDDATPTSPDEHPGETD